SVSAASQVCDGTQRQPGGTQRSDQAWRSSVVNLPHRELAQILRRAGNTLRLTIVPRASA
ncbi:hypothetical protein M9458_018275, partial [Cirrhinus mrigala]